MQAGDLRHRVVIKNKTATRDSFGQEVITWSTFATVWAAVEPLSGREYQAGQQTEAAVDTRIRIRYLAGVLPKMQVVYGSHTYNILSVLDTKGEMREIQLMCQEIIL